MSSVTYLKMTTKQFNSVQHNKTNFIGKISFHEHASIES